MSAWSADALTAIGAADELRIASYRPDGTLRPAVPIWVVRVGDDVYIRSAYGPDNGWFRRARTSGSGRIAVPGLEQDVVFAEPAPDVHPALDAAYHAKYDRYGPGIVGTVVGPDVVPVTLRVLPRE
ncbi:DUF2255 family protein [Cellulomonas xylanilytica]|uniref:DUF2255 family protein n=1 Tax=Cellulomonas xylanilytica TaxID=233583 RepID=A0A510V4G7_9CELL|nr:DUF2255 family protein [Cellulomonas xylanilytica]GEK21772.1 hypothetical protein CXY01_22920 [Cellulomonas xylanilytica]